MLYLFLHQIPYFFVIVVKYIEIVISSFKSKIIGNWTHLNKVHPWSTLVQDRKGLDRTQTRPFPNPSHKSNGGELDFSDGTLPRVRRPGDRRLMRHGVDCEKHRPVGNPKRKV
jgi:hypothetical protein